MIFYSLHITCKVWENTPNSLIDFESDENTSMTTIIDKKGILYKNGKVLHLLSNKSISNNKEVFLCKIDPKKDLYEINMNENEINNINELYDIDNIPWIISRYVFDNQWEHGYKMHEGDLFKLGKYILKVREIKLKKENLIKTMIESNQKIYKENEGDISKNIMLPNKNNINGCEPEPVIRLNQYNNDDDKNNIMISKKSYSLHNNNDNKRLKFNSEEFSSFHSSEEQKSINKKFSNVLNLNKFPLNNDSSVNKEVKKENSNIYKPTCRICLSEEYTEDNPLINPCKCAGTMKYLHLECLRQLIKSKIIKIINDNTTILSFKSLSCDICKSLFPENIKIKKKIYNIIDLERPDNEYLILDGIIKENPEQKSIFVINFKEPYKTIKIGRASDADVRLGDISVSRAHAQINLYNGYLVLNDTKSKFGTLINAGNFFCVLYNRPFSVQKGNIFLRFLMKMKLCRILTCYKPKNVEFDSYNSFFDSVEAMKCQIKDINNFIKTETQSVSEYEEKMEEKKRISNGKINNNISNNNNDRNNITQDMTISNAEYLKRNNRNDNNNNNNANKTIDFT